VTQLLWTIAGARRPGVEERRPGLYVVREELAKHWRVRRKVMGCRTWGEVRALGEDVHVEVLGLAGYGEYGDFVGHFEITGTAPGLSPSPVDEAEHALISAEGAPADDVSFAAYDLGACADGDWPPSTYRLVAESVTHELASRFGTLWETNFNGLYAVLDPNQRVALFDELAERGHDLVETPWLSELVDTF
jgi:hypothetical protein